MTEAAVVGVGTLSNLGCDTETLWRSVAAGENAFSTLVLREPDVVVPIAPATDFDPSESFKPHELRRMDRVHALAIVAARTATEGISDGVAPERRAIVFGTGQGPCEYLERESTRMAEQGIDRVSPLVIPVSMVNSISAMVAIDLGVHGLVQTVVTACASGSTAIGEALSLLRSDRADQVICGGMDAMINPALLAFFRRTDAMTRGADDGTFAVRPFDETRDGFILSEGATVMVLERPETAERLGHAPIAHVVGYGATTDAHHLVAPDESGEYQAAAMELALRDAKLRPEDIGHVNAHGTATRLNDVVEARAVRRCFGDVMPPVTAPKGQTGHAMGASGALEALIAMLCSKHGVVPPIVGLRSVDEECSHLDLVVGEPRRIEPGAPALSNSFGFGGHNSVLVVSA